MKNSFIEEVPRSLTNDEQIYLLEQLRLGNDEAREKLIVHNLRLVMHEANRICCSYVELDDRIASGIIGLIKAISTFDLSRGIKFSTYAKECIDNEILMLLRKERKENNRKGLSFNDVFYDGEKGRTLTFEEVIEDENSDFIQDYLDEEERKIIRKLVFSLPETEKSIITLYYGFNGKRYNQKQIGEILGLSQSYVSRKIIMTLNKLELELKSEYNNQRKRVLHKKLAK